MNHENAHPSATKSSLHPLLVGAAGAVILVSGLGAAAILGWLPSSAGKNTDPTLNANGQPLASQNATAAMPVAAVPQRDVRHEPVRQAERPVHTAPVHHAAAVCHDCGVIEAVNEIDSKGQGSGVGAVGGAVVGGLLGNQVGSGHGRQLATLAGAVGGAFAGNQIEGKVKTVRSYDITVHMNDGETRTIHQAEQPSWRSGDHVRIVDGALRANG
jgi:outer membrane lipoprotein SlyB